MREKSKAQLKDQTDATQIRQLIRDFEKAGWVLKGSHRKFEHAKVRYAITVSGSLGDDAHHYVKKGLRDAQ